jgi:spore germination protein
VRVLLRDNDRITPFELTVLMVIVTLEMGITTFPRTMTEKVGTESWLLPFPGFLFSLLAIYFIVRLSKLFPGKTFIEYSQDIVGPIIGKLLVAIVIAFWMSTSARILRQFADVMKVNLLFRTPIEIIIFSMLLFAAYPARHGIEPMARMAIIIAFATIPVGLFLFTFVIPQSE